VPRTADEYGSGDIETAENSGAGAISVLSRIGLFRISDLPVRRFTCSGSGKTSVLRV
jgi:hypothetical protein